MYLCFLSVRYSDIEVTVLLSVWHTDIDATVLMSVRYSDIDVSVFPFCVVVLCQCNCFCQSHGCYGNMICTLQLVRKGI